ncbi:kinase-like protein [Trametopsis cervina]|nr:kinase-like protein [Trametopsis cervina]
MFSKEFPKDYLLDRGFADTYVLEKELGKGGNGFVMSARHRGTGKKVAVKFMAKRKIAENAWMQVSESRWVPREIVLAYNLSHQYIIKCENDLFDDDMYFYIVQELHGDQWNHSSGSGNSLFDYRMQVGQLPERTARHIFKQIASGVMALHNMGVSHCDLKLENVLIDRKLNTKIIDLGSAVTAEPGASPPTYTRDTFCGTIPYAAPEIPGQERYEAAPTDVWCLGLILCELATGFSAVQRTSGPDELRDSGVLDECSRELQSLLLGFCLNADPKERATMAEVMAHPWMQQA